MEGITIVSLLLTAVFVLVCLFLILAPLFKGDSDLDNNQKSQELAGSKEALFTTLNEIEFEYKMDKLSESDYKQLKKQYETQIARIMKDEEELVDTKIDKELLAEVEREIEATMKGYKRKKGEMK